MLDTEARELVSENARLHAEIDALKAQLAEAQAEIDRILNERIDALSAAEARADAAEKEYIALRNEWAKRLEAMERSVIRSHRLYDDALAIIKLILDREEQ